MVNILLTALGSYLTLSPQKTQDHSLECLGTSFKNKIFNFL